MSYYKLVKVLLLTVWVVTDAYPTGLYQSTDIVFDNSAIVPTYRGRFFDFAEVPNMTSVEQFLVSQINFRPIFLAQWEFLTIAFGRITTTPLLLIPIGVVIAVVILSKYIEIDRLASIHYRSMMTSQCCCGCDCFHKRSYKPAAQTQNNVLNNMKTVGNKESGGSNSANRLAHLGRDTIIRNNLMLAAQRRSGNAPEEDDFSSSDDEKEPIIPPQTQDNPLRPEYVLAALGVELPENMRRQVENYNRRHQIEYSFPTSQSQSDDDAQPITESKSEPTAEDDSEAV